MPKDQAYLAAEQKIATNHPRMKTTNARMPAHIRLFVAQFVDGLSPKGG